VVETLVFTFVGFATLAVYMLVCISISYFLENMGIDTQNIEMGFVILVGTIIFFALCYAIGGAMLGGKI